LVFAGLGPHPGGFNYHDCSPYGNHGTLTNMDPPTDWVWVPELGRWAVDLDRASTQYINAQPVFNGATDATLAIWVRSPAFSGANYDTAICCKAGYSTAGMSIWTLTTGNVWLVRVEGGSTTIGNQVEGSWVHLAATYTSATTVTQCYYNGAATNSATASRAISTTVNLRCGTPSYGTTNVWTGRLTDPLAFTRALSSSEIAQIADPSNVMLSGLILPPRRRLWAVPAAAPAGFKAAWLNKQNRVIGGGVI
jgi:hypothetical protein